jgi:hypothetical protein
MHSLAETHPPDICLLLHAHSEQSWLTSRLVPVLEDLEHPGCIPEDQLGAALAYLEILWLDARSRAGQTDAARAHLGAEPDVFDDLYESARAYHAAVVRLRGELHHRVSGLIRTRVFVDSREHASG